MSVLMKLRDGYAAVAARAVLAEPAALLFARLVIARLFLLSGLNKWNGPFQFNPNSYDLFLYEFFCPEEPRGSLVLCADTVEGTYTPFMRFVVERFANLAGIMEVVLPILLILGLFGRFAALGLLGMAVFIELAVFPDVSSWWGSHVWWVAVLLILVARGPGAWSLDRLFKLEK